MKAKFKTFFKWSVITFSVIILIFITSFSCLYLSGDKVTFDQSKLSQYTNKIEFFDDENKPIKIQNTFNNKYAKISNLPEHVKQSFISIEDKNFYKHKGLNYKRMISALLSDIKNKNLSQGASTITQQLIKNTHLSSKKTFSRKINEIILAKKLEKVWTKDQILENYLNIIYFGNNCYGIENASWFYFSKPAKDLKLQESAMLAGIISSPAKYSPVTKLDACTKRRNIVLNEMKEDGFISEEEYKKISSMPIELNINKNTNNNLNTYTEAALDEAISILNMPAKQISIAGYKIYTNMNENKQKSLEKSAQKLTADNNYALISIQSDTGQIEAFVGNADYKILEHKRQPGSSLKPILVYAPALNEDIITPYTQILDEPLSVSDYTPQNHDGKFRGYVSAQEAITMSLNIPAVKILSYTKIDKSINYAKKCGIEFDDADNNYSIALGGMTHGTTVKDLAGAYTALANYGKYNKPVFVKYITDKNGKIVYISQQKENKVFREDTAFLMTDMLIKTSQEGTSKRLKDLPYQVASKTGTVGKGQNNYDAWAISYTTQDIVGVWIGNLDNKPIGNIVGGTEPIEATKEYMQDIYQTSFPNDYSVPSTVTQQEIDLIELQNNHQVCKANAFIPPKSKLTGYFSRFNLPQEKQLNIKQKASNLDGKVNNGKAVLTFEAENFKIYNLYCNNKLIKTFEGCNGKIEYEHQLNQEENKFYLVTILKNWQTDEVLTQTSNTITLINHNKNKSQWYI